MAAMSSFDSDPQVERHPWQRIVVAAVLMPVYLHLAACSAQMSRSTGVGDHVEALAGLVPAVPFLVVIPWLLLSIVDCRYRASKRAKAVAMCLLTVFVVCTFWLMLLWGR
jgi:predicted anti-sigma-YlaC factor YlaD